MASPEKCSFLALRRPVRDDIYQRVHVVAHPLYLFKDVRSPKVELFAPENGGAGQPCSLPVDS
jgi:hypothetical protein